MALLFFLLLALNVSRTQSAPAECRKLGGSSWTTNGLSEYLSISEFLLPDFMFYEKKKSFLTHST